PTTQTPSTQPPSTEPATTEPAQVPTDGDEAIATVLSAHVGTSAPTAVLALTMDGATTRRAVAGTVSVDDDTQVTLDAQVDLGSDVKAMTAVVLAQVLDEHGLSVASTLAEVLPGVPMDDGYRSVTIAELLAHRAGLDDAALGALLPDLAELPEAEARDAGARAALAMPPHDPLRAFAYSNAGYAIAGWIVEQLTGDAYMHQMQQRLFTPLAMDCSAGSPQRPTSPVGHDERGQPDGRDSPIPEVLTPAGRVSCTMEGWSHFVGAVMTLASGAPSDLLPADAAAALYTLPDGWEYVAGWLAQTNPIAGLFLAHDGSNLHWYARAVLLVDSAQALLLAANAGDDSMPSMFDSLAQEVGTATE
ncbi:MAG: serine hydrolase domain-containing protein, partial [Ilumatobacteraceae bacterium]